MHKKHKQIKFLESLIFNPINSNFQALFKENCQFSRWVEKSSTFQDSSQIQALFNVCGNHAVITSTKKLCLKLMVSQLSSVSKIGLD